MALIEAFLELGHAVTFLALGEFFLPPDARDPSARAALAQRGVTCLAPPGDAMESGDGGIRAALAQCGEIGVCVLSRVTCGGAFFGPLRAAFPQARFVFMPRDLHFLREAREARVLGLEGGASGAAATREKERRLIADCDATLLVSWHECAVAADLVPGADLVHLPLTRVAEVGATPAGRRDITFIGNFGHRPNGDAMVAFLAQTWPLLTRAMPDLTLHVIGENPPDGLRARPGAARDAAGHVVVHGHVPDLDGMLAGLCLTIAPLRYGAGAKGKVVSSLARGVPCVMSEIAAEGLALPGLISDHCAASAPDVVMARILRLIEDDTLWQAVPTAGTAFIAAEHAPHILRARVEGLLSRLAQRPRQPRLTFKTRS